MIGKWIICKRDGRERDPRAATPVRVVNVTKGTGYNMLYKNWLDEKTEYAFFEGYASYFTKRGINLDALPSTTF